MKKLIMVLGNGRMGQPTVSFLRKFGYDVMVVDKNYYIPYYNDDKLPSSTLDIEYLITTFSPHLVVSTLPYTENLRVAEFCIENSIDYCDLGGKLENTNVIRKLSEGKDVRIGIDLGLAPGLINILTEYKLSKNNNTRHVMCAVGGIPTEDIDPPFNYVVTWSEEGLVNEYTDTCEVLSEGMKIKLSALNGHEHFQSKLLNKQLECFLTSGASAHSIARMKTLGVSSFAYKTIRYKGHRNFVKSIIDDDNGKDNMINIFRRLSDTAPCKTDMILGLIRLDYENYEFLIKGNDNMTAMQIATAGPLAAIASLIVEGHLPKRFLTYTDYVKHFGYIKCKLGELGVEL